MNSSHVVNCGLFVIHPVYTNDPSTDKTSDIAACVLNIILSVFTVIGNISVILAYYNNRHLQTKSNFLILNLAITDFVVGIWVQPSFVWIKVTQMHEKIDCGMEIASDLSTKFCTTVSVLLLGVVVSLERYLAIFHPLKHRASLTKNKLLGSVVFVWLGVMIVIAMIPLGIPARVYQSLGLFLIFISLMTSVSVYAKIGKKLRKANNQTRPIEVEPRPQFKIEFVCRLSAEQQIKASVTLFYVLSALFVSYLPMIAGFIYVSVHGQNIMYQRFWWTWGVTCLFLNSFCNPLIYSWRNRHMSLAIRRLFVKRNSAVASGLNMTMLPVTVGR